MKLEGCMTDDDHKEMYDSDNHIERAYMNCDKKTRPSMVITSINEKVYCVSLACSPGDTRDR